MRTNRWRTRAFVLAIAIAGPATAEIVSNCSFPVDSVESCGVAPSGCWIESLDINLPWHVPPPPEASNTKKYRAFCSPANASNGQDGNWYSYAIYLPPGYSLPENANIEYPVVYWLHGTLDEPLEWFGRGTNIATAVNKRTLQRKMRPTIYVFPYGGVYTDTGPFDWVDQWTDGFEPDDHPGCDPDKPGRCLRADTAFEELIAHVESNYRAISDPSGRGIQGFSRGGGYAVQRGFRPKGGVYGFSSVVGLSPGMYWEAAHFEEDAEFLARDYADQYPDDKDRPMEVMLKHGDLDLDQSAIPTLEFSEFLLNGLQGNDDPISHSIEHVVPRCGEERLYAPPCSPSEQPPILGHDQPRMKNLRGDEVMAFHQAAFSSKLSPSEIANLDSHRLPCADLLSFSTDAAPILGVNDGYLAGDWNGDGCSTIGVVHNGDVYIDDDFDQFIDNTAEVGRPGVRFFSIDWFDGGDDKIGTAKFETAACPKGWEIRFWTADRDGDGHDAKDEPYFCFEDAPEDTDFLVGDFDGDWRDDVAYRDENDFYWTPYLASGHDGTIAGTTRYGKKTGEDQYAAGRWFHSQPSTALGIRRDAELLLNKNLDGGHDLEFEFGGPNEDQYLFGDWDGDGRTNVASRRCNLLFLDVDFDTAHEYQFSLGWGTPGDC